MLHGLRLWIAAALVAVLAFPAAPMPAHAMRGHDCCPGAAQAHASGGMADGASGVDEDSGPMTCSATEGGSDGSALRLPGPGCLHCFAAAVAGAPALLSVASAAEIVPTVYVPAAVGPAFVPAARPDRVERPPSPSF